MGEVLFYVHPCEHQLRGAVSIENPKLTAATIQCPYCLEDGKGPATFDLAMLREANSAATKKEG